MKYYLGFLLLLNTASAMYAQEKKTEVIFHGVILDAFTKEPVPNVHIYYNNKGAVSNDSGYYRIKTGIGDTIIFSHISYIRDSFIVPDTLENKSYRFDMALIRDTKILKESMVFGMNRSEFKAEFLNMEPDREFQNLRKNLYYATLLSRIPDDRPLSTADIQNRVLKGHETRLIYKHQISPEYIANPFLLIKAIRVLIEEMENR